jgi:hypothetical protein
MDFALFIEGNGIKREEVENYEEVKTKIISQLEVLRN